MPKQPHTTANTTHPNRVKPNVVVVFTAILTHTGQGEREEEEEEEEG